MNSTLTEVLNKIYNVGIYIRLSKEDENVGMSESVINQKRFLTSWVQEKGHNLIDIYIDDGYSGTNFDRPSFQKMLKDIDNKKINMVITKDMSRLGRDYIGTGEYIEKYFPQKGVRYIAVTDNIDTEYDTANNDIAPFKSVLNDMYSRDISKKIRTSLYSKQKEGLWVGGCTPLGYMQDPNNKNHLVPDPQEDWIVKKIFSLALTGYTVYKISEILTNEKIPTRTMIKNNNRNKNATNSRNGYWSPKTIKHILKNHLYTGDMVQGKQKRISYKVRKVILNNEENWIIVKNTHEPLVSKKDFQVVQKLLPKSSVKNNKKNIRLLDGLLYCFECKHKIGICNPRTNKSGNTYTYTVCNYYRLYSKHNLCTSHGFNYDIIEKCVLDELKMTLNKYLNKKELEKQIKKINFKNPIDKLKEKLETITSRLEKSINNLDKIYIDKIENKITEEMYNRIYIKILNENEQLEKNKKELEKEIENLNNRNNLKNIDLNKFIEDFIKMENPPRDILLKLIDKIYIHKDKQIDIYWSFKEANFL